MKTAEESAFFGSAKLTVGALSPSLNFEFHHLLPNTRHLHGYGNQQKAKPRLLLGFFASCNQKFYKRTEFSYKIGCPL